MSELEHDIDPGVLALVAAIRDRFGVRGLREASTLIDAEIVRISAETQAAFEEP